MPPYLYGRTTTQVFTVPGPFNAWKISTRDPTMAALPRVPHHHEALVGQHLEQSEEHVLTFDRSRGFTFSSWGGWIKLDIHRHTMATSHGLPMSDDTVVVVKSIGSPTSAMIAIVDMLHLWTSIDWCSNNSGDFYLIAMMAFRWISWLSQLDICIIVILSTNHLQPQSLQLFVPWRLGRSRYMFDRMICIKMDHVWTMFIRLDITIHWPRYPML